MTARVSELIVGQHIDGRDIKQYHLINTTGAKATFLNLGAAWVGFKLSEDGPDVVLGCDTLDAFLDQQANLGMTIGRYANRISLGQFQLNGESYQVDVNLPPHHLHGGRNGFAQQLWDSSFALENDVTPSVTFTYHSEDGEMGFPGNLEVQVKITLSEDNAVRFEYTATCDRPSIINLTNHAYFNLDGQSFGSLKHHEFKIESESLLDSDDQSLPTGDVLNTKDSPFDLKHWTSVYPQLQTLTDPRLKRAEGYDHCYCYDQNRSLTLLASARSLNSGIELQCFSDLPGMQFYTGNFLGGTPINHEHTYQRHGAFCFEPGFWPDSPNHAHFPDCTIDVNKSYSGIIVYTFNKQDEGT